MVDARQKHACGDGALPAERTQWETAEEVVPLVAQIDAGEEGLAGGDGAIQSEQGNAGTLGNSVRPEGTGICSVLRHALRTPEDNDSIE